MQVITPSPPVRAQGSGAPPANERVKITEADRMAWMRQYLGALEQWKTALDTMLDSGTFASAAANAGGPAASLISAIVGTGSSSGSADPPAPKPDLAPPPAGMEGGLVPQVAGAGLLDTGGAPVDGSAPQDPNALAAFSAPIQAQYMQQVQFWQQMQAHESRGKGGSAPSSRRFKDSFRPMRLCKHLVQMGVCRQADQCTFAHTFEELHPSSPDVPKLAELNLTNALAEQQAMPATGTNPAPNSAASGSDAMPDLRLKKKRELCERFARGYCTLGKVCSFAHGEDELNTVGLAVCGKVKTQVCRNWQAGRCIYGNLCNNAHGEQEIGTKRPPPELAPPMKRRKEDEENELVNNAWGAEGSGEGQLAAQPSQGW